MLRSIKIKKSALDNSSAENTTQELFKETATQFSSTMPKTDNCFTNFFRRIACSSPKLIDDESEALIMPKADPK